MDGNNFLSFTCLMVYCHSPTKVSQRIVISMISVKLQSGVQVKKIVIPLKNVMPSEKSCFNCLNTSVHKFQQLV